MKVQKIRSAKIQLFMLFLQSTWSPDPGPRDPFVAAAPVDSAAGV